MSRRWSLSKSKTGWTKIVVDGIAKTGKPVIGFGIEGHGDIATIAKASYKAKDFVQWASELKREECGIADLWVSTKCGESDTTTGVVVPNCRQHVRQADPERYLWRVR